MNREPTQRDEQRAQERPTTAEETDEHEETEGRLTSYLHEHEWPQLTAGVAAAAGAGLLLVSMLGVGPAAVVGGAGYLAYRELSGKRSRAATTKGSDR